MKKGLGLSLLLVAACMPAISVAGVTYLAPALIVLQTSANESRFRGLAPRLSLGYLQPCGNYAYAGEVFFTPSTLTLSDTKNPGASSTRTSLNVGASFMPGTYFYKDLLGYARIGLVNTKFSSPNVFRVGTQLGFGLQSSLNPCWSLRGEYLYTIYGSVSKVGTPNTNQVGVSLVYFTSA